MTVRLVTSCASCATSVYCTSAAASVAFDDDDDVELLDDDVELPEEVELVVPVPVPVPVPVVVLVSALPLMYCVVWDGRTCMSNATLPARTATILTRDGEICKSTTHSNRRQSVRRGDGRGLRGFEGKTCIRGCAYTCVDECVCVGMCVSVCVYTWSITGHRTIPPSLHRLHHEQVTVWGSRTCNRVAMFWMMFGP